MSASILAKMDAQIGSALDTLPTVPAFANNPEIKLHKGKPGTLPAHMCVMSSAPTALVQPPVMRG